MLIVLLSKATLGLLAALGLPKFQYELARAYYTARFGEQNPGEAAKWCRRAAEQGWPPAESLLAQFHVGAFGVAEDWDQVFYWNRRAAEHGDPWGQIALAWCYRQGVGTQQDTGLAFKWWLEAAQQGLPEAQYAVADCLFSGTGAPMDLEMADQWCRLALENGAESAPELLRRIEAASCTAQ